MPKKPAVSKKTSSKKKPLKNGPRSSRGSRSTPNATHTPNKASFIRSLSPNISAREAVAEGKAAGISLTEAYVYAIRSSTKLAKKRASASGGESPPSGPWNGAPARSPEAAFRRLVLDLGLARSRRLLDEVERGLQAVIAGL